MSEQWLSIVGFEGSYEVSDLGCIRSLDRYVRHNWGGLRKVRGQPLVVHPDSNGLYMQVSLGRGTKYLVHRLVLEAFVGRCPDGMEGCHGDDNPKNNSLANLRWDTPTANAADRDRKQEAA